MSYLYCAVDGRGHENRVIGQQELYRQEGESVVIVHGTLTSGPHRCDTCNATLHRGDVATVLSAFPRHLTEGMDGYEFTSERRYFDRRTTTVAVYGAPWPGLTRRLPAHSGN